MDIVELRTKQGEFEGKRQGLKKRFSHLEQLRRRFVTEFTPEKLRKLPIKRYVVGYGQKNTFCYWLETKLMPLGKIKGGSPADKKFGIYYGKTKSDPTVKYRWVKKFGDSQEEAYSNILQEILALIEAGQRNDIDKIVANKLSPMFKGKILSTYYSDKYLGIFSNEHLDYFLEKTGLISEETDRLGQVRKRELLMNFKTSDAVMEHWTVFEFYTFLYDKFGKPVRDTEVVPKDLKDYIETKYPPIDQLDTEFVDLSIGNIVDKGRKGKSTKRVKIDYEKVNRENKKLGDRGELIVLRAEKECLASIGKIELTGEHTSKKDDSAGYDILSYDEYGRKKYIEVKSTKSKVSNADFAISASEKEKAQELENYFIYLVFEAHTAKPKIFRLKKPFDLRDKQIRITPMNYRVQINLKPQS